MASAKPTKNDIIALETSYWDAMKAKDGSKAQELSGKTSLVTGARGVVSMPTDDVAIIAYTVRQKVTMDGKKQDLHAADSSTWIRGANGWECHAHSETYLQEK